MSLRESFFVVPGFRRICSWTIVIEERLAQFQGLLGEDGNCPARRGGFRTAGVFDYLLGRIRLYCPMSDAAVPKPRWYRLTPDRFVIGLLVLEGFLLLSQRFQWLGFNRHKGCTVLIAMAIVGVGCC